MKPYMSEIFALLVAAVTFVLRNWQRLASSAKRRELILKISEWAWRDTEVWAASDAELGQLSGATRSVAKLKHFVERLNEWLEASGQAPLKDDEKAGPATWADIRSNAAKLPPTGEALPPAPNRTVLDSGLHERATRPPTIPPGDVR